jgi:hypothetical protein
MSRIYQSSPYRTAAPARYSCLADGGSGTWLYVRSPAPLVYVFIEIMDLPDAMGRDATARWSASVDVVDLTSTSPDTIASAIRSCGWEQDDDTAPDPLAIAEMCHQYGAKSPMWDDCAGPVNARNYHDSPGEEHRPFQTLRAAARREADRLCSEDYREEQLDTRVVNAIGQTAREYANGTAGLWDALRRIAADPNASAEQKLVLKMYGNAGMTLGGDAVPSDLVNDDG